MKKLVLLLTAVLFIGSGVFAQQSKKMRAGSRITYKSSSPAINKAHRVMPKMMGAANDNVPWNTNRSRSLVAARTRPVTTQTQVANEAIIGGTAYDLQTNSSISNRFVYNPYDGTASAVWTMSQQPLGSGWTDRGTGYNYLDGVNGWGPISNTRVEPIRTGFTNVAYAQGGYEAILAHTSGATTGEPLNARPTKGTGSWTERDTIAGTGAADLWPKFAAGGANGQSLHAIWQGTGTASGPLYYSRSTDNGVTWTPKAEIPQFVMGVDYAGLSADCYSIDVRGDVVAIAVGDLATNLVLLKSIDNGATFTSTVIDSFPIPLYDAATMNTYLPGDTAASKIFSNTGDPAVVIDNNNQAHVFFSGTDVIEDSGATGLSYYFVSSLYYWNETMLPNQSVFLSQPPDLNGDSVVSLPQGCNFDPANYPVGYYATGLRAYIQCPSAGVDANNNIYCVYQAVDELSDTTLDDQVFMHPYIIKSLDGGASWTYPDDALDAVLATQPVDGQSYDGVFASMSKQNDGKVRLIYQRDFAPGTTLSGSTAATCESDANNSAVNDIVYVEIDTMDIPLARILTGIQNPASTSFTVSSNYPNPFSGKTSFDISLKKASDVRVEVSNMLGQVLTVNKYTNLNAGNHVLGIDASKFASGIYTYTVRVGNDVVTKKMTVQ